LLRTQELNRIHFVVDRSANENSDEIIRQRIDSFEVYAFNIESPVKSLIRLIKRKLQRSLRPTLKLHAVSEQIVVAAENKRRGNLSASKLHLCFDIVTFGRQRLCDLRLSIKLRFPFAKRPFTARPQPTAHGRRICETDFSVHMFSATLA